MSDRQERREEKVEFWAAVIAWEESLGACCSGLLLRVLGGKEQWRRFNQRRWKRVFGEGEHESQSSHFCLKQMKQARSTDEGAICVRYE